MKHHSPLVSIGVPVYNGDRYVREALESLVTQTYPNLEIIVSDNASRDGTEAICAEFAERDPRVRYLRQRTNIGAIGNFNRVFELARGPYFMWAAHDDMRHPEAVVRCVEALEANPAAVLCCTGMRFIAEDGRDAEPLPDGCVVMPSGASRLERVRKVASANHWYGFYGLMRHAALEQTRLCRPVWGFDVVVELEVALRGEVVAIPEPLLVYRVFQQKTGTDQAATLGSPSAGGIRVSYLDTFIELIRAIWLCPAPRMERVALCEQFVREFLVRNGCMSEFVRSEAKARVCGAIRARSAGQLIKAAPVSALVFGAQPRRAARALVHRVLRHSRSI